MDLLALGDELEDMVDVEPGEDRLQLRALAGEQAFKLRAGFLEELGGVAQFRFEGCEAMTGLGLMTVNSTN